MENNNKGSFRVPYPVLLLLGTIFVAAVTWGITSASSKRQDVASISATTRQVEVNTKVINDEIKPDIQRLKDTKVDKDQFDKLYDLLLKVNDKLDVHMSKK